MPLHPACAALLGVLALGGCQGQSGTVGTPGTDDADSAGTLDTRDSQPPAPRTLRFADVGLPQDEDAGRTARASPQVWLDDQSYATAYQIQLRGRDSPDGDAVFGRLIGADGTPLLNGDGEEIVSADQEFSSLHQTSSGAIVGISHVEDSPGALYRTLLDQDPDSGTLTATATAPLDLSDLGGLHVPCAASMTPWGSHLGGEEYPPDARRWENAEEWSDLSSYIKGFARYWGHDIYTDDDEDRIPDNIVLDDLRQDYDPYRYGFPFEVSVSDDDTDVVRHRSLGRTSVELALVMPDQRTVYVSDDESNGALYLYVADVAGDLSAGTLYAMVWTQTDDAGAGQADLDWVSLGHATDAEIDGHVAAGTSFSDLFRATDSLRDKEGSPTYTCPVGYSPVNTTFGFECLDLIDGMAVAASRLETDRYAALMGATTELRKSEGITHDPDNERLYLAISEIDHGMLDEGKGGHDDGGRNDIRLDQNDCGAVYGLALGTDHTVGSDHVAQRASAVLVGTETPFPLSKLFAENGCLVSGIANPDNLHYLPGYHLLLVAEDSRMQQNDSVWAYHVRDGTLDRIFTAPYGAENTGIYTFTLGAWTYLKVVVHGPFDERGLPAAETPQDKEGTDGIIGPLPALW